MPKPPVIPDACIARSTGIFPLVGGPLCGLFTDRAPDGSDLTIRLDYCDRLRRHWCCTYELQTVGRYAPRYLCVDVDRAAWRLL